MNGPLAGTTVVELAGLGPAPFAGMVLADLGADVIRVDRTTGVDPDAPGLERYDLLNRGKRSVGVDLKSEAGAEVVLGLVAVSDALLEGFRPGVADRLGVGPEACHRLNPALVYGRMTGWGQTGPLAASAGHDINYISLSGVLGAIGTDAPVPPLNLVGDFGGGGMLLVVGILAGMQAAQQGATNQVVDAAMIDGSALLSSMQHSMLLSGLWSDRRNSNLLDGAAPFYTTYRTSDDRHVAVGALEPQFFAALVEGLGLDMSDLPAQMDTASWPELRSLFASLFAERSMEEWMRVFEGSDACVTPVLRFGEAPSHRQNMSRDTFVEVHDMIQPAPAPRFSATPTDLPGRPALPGEHTDEVLAGLGFSEDQIGKLRATGAIA